MMSRLLRALAHFRGGEDGSSTAEYAVTGAVFVGGVCIVVMLAQENNASNIKAEYVTFKVDTEETITTGRETRRSARSQPVSNGESRESGVKLLDIHGGKDGADKIKGPGSDGGTAHDQGNAGRTRLVESGLGAEDARQAILALIKTSPNTFATSRRAVQTAPIIRENDMVRIDAFTCYLKSKEFAYRPDNNADQSSGIHGVFYRNEKGKWTATVTQSGR